MTPVTDAKTCPTCDGEGLMYELPGEPHCETCGGCGDVAVDCSRLEVLSHGEARTTGPSAVERDRAKIRDGLSETLAPFKPGDWVIRRDWLQLAKVKDYTPASGRWEATLDLVIYDRSGERIGRESPAMGGPRGFEPCCPASDWAQILKPAFPLQKYEPMFRVVKFINPADVPVDDGRI